MKGLVNGTSSKVLVSILGAAATSLNTYYGNTHWVSVVTAALTAVTVYLVPNKTQP